MLWFLHTLLLTPSYCHTDRDSLDLVVTDVVVTPVPIGVGRIEDRVFFGELCTYNFILVDSHVVGI